MDGEGAPLDRGGVEVAVLDVEVARGHCLRPQPVEQGNLGPAGYTHWKDDHNYHLNKTIPKKESEAKFRKIITATFHDFNWCQLESWKLKCRMRRSCKKEKTKMNITYNQRFWDFVSSWKASR